MYPNLYFLVKDLFGIEIGFLQIINTFGFFVALAFLGAATVLSKELKRKEEQGLMKPVPQKRLVGAAATPFELIGNGLLGFLIGFKLFGAIADFDTVVLDPQDFILSFRGSFIGGLIVAFISAYLRYREKQKERLDKPEMRTEMVSPYTMVGDITIVAAIGGFLGAKIFHNLEYWQAFTADPIGQLLAFSGLTFYGGLICGAGAVYYYCWRKGLSIWHINDATAPGLMLAYGLGRIGCHVAGDGDWGVDNLAPKPDMLSFLPDWMWSYNYPHHVLMDGILIPGCEGKYCYALANPVWPTAFYEIVMGIALFGLMWALRKHINIPGMMISFYMLLNGIERYLIQQIRIEQIRADAQYDLFGWQIAQAELIAIFMILGGIGGMLWLWRRRA